jgi:two-component sensor histidine kinase
MITRRFLRTAEAAAATVATIVMLTAYVTMFFEGYPGQTYPIILGMAGIVAWRYGPIAAGVMLAGTSLGIDIYVLEGTGLAIAKPEQAIGLVILVGVGIGLIWATRTVKRDRDAMLHTIAERSRLAASRGEQLDELVHRVRNDLGAMAAMASVYGRSANPSGGLNAMGERISVLGRLYQRLHVGDAQGTEIGMDVFLGEIVEDLRATRLDLMPVSIVTDIQQVILPMRTAAVIGMIMNEAVTNALKYAFPDERQGRIEATLARLTGDRLCLTIKDDGVGPDGGPAKGTGMGTRLMRAMAAQIGGTYTMKRQEELTVITVEFPAD